VLWPGGAAGAGDAPRSWLSPPPGSAVVPVSAKAPEGRASGGGGDHTPPTAQAGTRSATSTASDVSGRGALDQPGSSEPAAGS